MNVFKKTRPASKKTPDERMAYLVVVIVQEGNNKQFRVCLMSQNSGGGRALIGAAGVILFINFRQIRLQTSPNIAMYGEKR